MKRLIILQNGPVFTVDVSKIFNQGFLDLYLIVNQKSYECLCDRNQHFLFKKIQIIADFSFDNLVSIINSMMQNADRELVVLATNSESLVGVTGRLREHFNIIGLHSDAANVFTDKISMKKHMLKFNVKIPNFIAFDRNEYLASPEFYIKNISDQLSFPIIAKPTNSAGSKDVKKITDVNELKQWAIDAKKDEFELDEFIFGNLYHCDSFICNGRILYTAVCRYSSLTHEFMLGSNLGSITLPDEDAVCKKLKIFNDNILKNISNNLSGVIHLEVFEDNNGTLVFLEIANRGGGAGVPPMYSKHLNIDLFSTHFVLQFIDNYERNITRRCYSAWMQFPPSSNVMGMNDIPKIKSKINCVFKNEKINKSSPCSSLRDYSLMVVLWNNDFIKLNHDFKMLTRLSLG